MHSLPEGLCEAVIEKPGRHISANLRIRQTQGECTRISKVRSTLMRVIARYIHEHAGIDRRNPQFPYLARVT